MKNEPYSTIYARQYLKDPIKRAKKNAYHRELNLEYKLNAFKHLGNKCSMCGFSDPRALQIDHVNGGGRQDRKKMCYTKFYRIVATDVSGKYQLLCANCNWIKKFDRNEL